MRKTPNFTDANIGICSVLHFTADAKFIAGSLILILRCENSISGCTANIPPIRNAIWKPSVKPVLELKSAVESPIWNFANGCFMPAVKPHSVRKPGAALAPNRLVAQHRSKHIRATIFANLFISIKKIVPSNILTFLQISDKNTANLYENFVLPTIYTIFAVKFHERKFRIL